ncbi:MAG: hypothetical protein HGA76_03175 [Candidatus Firestonebacteria bacterium]|nr:hypothetical protein [Candidatus Firestonebacteria bacterium]
MNRWLAFLMGLLLLAGTAFGAGMTSKFETAGLSGAITGHAGPGGNRGNTGEIIKNHSRP